jgi:hypothetical protein
MFGLSVLASRAREGFSLYTTVRQSEVELFDGIDVATKAIPASPILLKRLLITTR